VSAGVKKIQSGGGSKWLHDVQLDDLQCQGCLFIYLPVLKTQLESGTIIRVKLPAAWVHQLSCDFRHPSDFLSPSSFKSAASRGSSLVSLHPLRERDEADSAELDKHFPPAGVDVHIVGMTRLTDTFKKLEQRRLDGTPPPLADAQLPACLHGVSVADLTAAAAEKLRLFEELVQDEQQDPSSFFKPQSSSPLCLDRVTDSHAAAGLSRRIEEDAITKLFRSRIHFDGQLDIGAHPLSLQPAGLPAVQHQLSGERLLIMMPYTEQRSASLQRLATDMLLKHREHCGQAELPSCWTNLESSLRCILDDLAASLLYAGMLMPSLSQLSDAGVDWHPLLMSANHAVILPADMFTMSVTSSTTTSAFIEANQLDARYLQSCRGLICVGHFFQWLERLQSHAVNQRLHGLLERLDVPLQAMQRAVQSVPMEVAELLCCAGDVWPSSAKRDAAATEKLRSQLHLQRLLLDCLASQPAMNEEPGGSAEAATLNPMRQSSIQEAEQNRHMLPASGDPAEERKQAEEHGASHHAP